MVEIWPGGGWYTEILAPYVLRGGGTYYAAAMGMTANRLNARPPDDGGQSRALRRHPLAAFPTFAADETRVPDGSADVVLTFRNVHNWQMGYQRDSQPYAEEAFRQMFAMLRPGGTLGVVDHRLPESADAERERTSGYVKVSTVRRLAEAAGFRFVGASEVNANPQRHRRLAARRLDAAADLPPRRRGPRPLRRDRRERPDDAAVRQAPLNSDSHHFQPLSWSSLLLELGELRP